MAAAKQPRKRKPKLPSDDLAPDLEDEESNELLEELSNIDQPEVPTTEGRDRAALAAIVELNPASLAGSWFIRVENGEAVWWGIIVAEVQAGAYLCQVNAGLEGGPAQVVFSLDRMEAKDEGYEFRFFDTEDAMRAAFAALDSAERREPV